MYVPINIILRRFNILAESTAFLPPQPPTARYSGIATQIDELSSGLEHGLLDVDAAASEQAVYVKNLLSRARRAKNRLKARWDLLDENGNYTFSATTDTFLDLQRFFPDADIAHLDDIEGFHRIISSVFKSELRTERSKLEKELKEYDRIIYEYETQLKELIRNPNLSKVILARHANLLREKDRMQKENESYSCGSYGADGDFGSATDKAVRRFQSAKGIGVDGIVGSNTWSKLLK